MCFRDRPFGPGRGLETASGQHPCPRAFVPNANAFRHISLSAVTRGNGAGISMETSRPPKQVSSGARQKILPACAANVRRHR